MKRSIIDFLKLSDERDFRILLTLLFLSGMIAAAFIL